MSEKLLDFSEIRQDLSDFITQVARRSNLNVTRDEIQHTYIDRVDRLHTSYGPFWNLSGINTVHLIDIGLVEHKEVKVYIVCTFDITSTEVTKPPLYVSGIKVLRYYGKRLATGDDFQMSLDGKLWEIRYPANLEALLRAYNNVARLHDLGQIFNLP